MRFCGLRAQGLQLRGGVGAQRFLGLGHEVRVMLKYSARAEATLDGGNLAGLHNPGALKLA